MESTKAIDIPIAKIFHAFSKYNWFMYIGMD